MTPTSHLVRYRTASVTVYPVTVDGRTYWRFCKGRKTVTRASLDKAKTEARAYAESSFLTGAKLPLLAEPQVRAIQRMLDADPQLSLVEDFLHWHARQCPRHDLDDARWEFLAAKRANAGASPHNVRTLERHLGTLPAMVLADVGLSDLPPLTGAPRSRKNRIAAWRSFFTWCRSRGYLPDGDTVADKLDVPAVPRTTPETWTPDELAILIANVRAEYLPWLLLSAWAGLRTEEICPDPQSKKSPLLWSDFEWERGLLIVRAETAKTGQRRVIPICAALASILPRDRVGIVGPHLPPHTPAKGGKLSETTRLGKLVGGWRRNALRHSFLSYRAAQVGIAQAAREAGNSEAVARRVYEDAKGADEAEKWFSIPNLTGNVHVHNTYPLPTLHA
jgi:integrase